MPALSEPYAEWGVFADGSPLEDFSSGDEVPEASEVFFPPPPQGVFVGTTVGSGSCLIIMRSKRSVEDVCKFYGEKLIGAGYQRVKSAEVKGGASCAIYKDGNAGHQGIGVQVYKDEDRLMVINGATLIILSYKPMAHDDCND
ncbi:hypothetical protein [Marinobacter sp. NFXS9]|uniref:hypothetical protein n=1 Tax=Marinobacter sp. NFXS9 TaxID=2818433 RepID=UPI0032DEC4AC